MSERLKSLLSCAFYFFSIFLLFKPLQGAGIQLVPVGKILLSDFFLALSCGAFGIITDLITFDSNGTKPFFYLTSSGHFFGAAYIVVYSLFLEAVRASFFVSFGALPSIAVISILSFPFFGMSSRNFGVIFRSLVCCLILRDTKLLWVNWFASIIFCSYLFVETKVSHLLEQERNLVE